MILKSSLQKLYVVNLEQQIISCTITVGRPTMLQYDPVVPTVLSVRNISKPVVLFKNHINVFETAAVPTNCKWK